MRRLLAVVTAAGLLLPAPAGSAGADVAPPLTATFGTQDGTPYHTVVRRKSAKHCSSLHARHVGRFPEPVLHDGEALVWQVSGAGRPRVGVTLWRAGTDQGPLGPAEALAVTLTPVRSRGRTVAWDAASKPVGYGEFHLRASVEWAAGECGRDFGSYHYRVRSLPLPGPGRAPRRPVPDAGRAAR